MLLSAFNITQLEYEVVSNHPDAGTSGLNGSFSKYQEQDFDRSG